ncbi:hypothetical protein BC938DRAFT_483757 [Jimgerdemannia flammicorona]|uniref:Uncharacterized protein n=1 Tax=Jimgerdemannia flammicorona TaxID=994334 RepID=A0A433QB90_9FUNG|nr:hypothetical protein BC938DRAFT_483757 [Jimgerdemannia flammicorona]
MRYITFLVLGALSLFAQAAAQSCWTNGDLGCANEGVTGDVWVCVNNNQVHQQCGAGSVCCMTNTGDAQCMSSCPPDRHGLVDSHIKMKAKRSKKGKAKHTAASGFTINNAIGTRYGVALKGNACGISGTNPSVAVHPSVSDHDILAQTISSSPSAGRMRMGMSPTSSTLSKIGNPVTFLLCPVAKPNPGKAGARAREESKRQGTQ